MKSIPHIIFGHVCMVSQRAGIIAHVAPLPFHAAILTWAVGHNGCITRLGFIAEVAGDQSTNMRLGVVGVHMANHHMHAARVVDELTNATQDLILCLIAKQDHIIEFGI